MTDIITIKRKNINKKKQSDRVFTWSQKINVKACSYLMTCKNDEFAQGIYPINDNGKKKTPKEINKEINEYKGRIKTILKKSSNSELALDYKIGTSNRIEWDESWHTSLYSMTRLVRNFIMSDDLVDIDLANSHFRILLHLCEKHKIRCDFIKQYAYDRNEILAREELKLPKKYTTKKQYICALLNQDTPKSTQNKWFDELVKEIIYAKDILLEKEKGVVHPRYKPKKDYNLKSSRFSNILCYYETKALLIILDSVGSKASIPMSDGFAGHKSVDIEELNKKLKKQYPQCKVVKKDTETCFKLPEGFESEDYMDEDELYEKKKLEFEAKYKFISKNGFFKALVDRWAYVENEMDETIETRSDDYMMMVKKTLIDDIQHWGKYPLLIGSKREKQYMSDGTIIKKDFLAVWLADHDRVAFDYQDFRPYLNTDPMPKNVFNLFTGFKYKAGKEKVPEEKVKWFLDYMNAVFNDPTEPAKVKDYLIKYLAHLVQKPHIKTETLLVIRGLQGAGKDSFVNIIEALIGHEWVGRPQGLEAVFGGSFNSSNITKLVLACNEVEGKDGTKHKESLKDQSTKRFIDPVKEKYVNEYKVMNYQNYILLANNFTPLTADAEGRREVLIQVMETWIGEKKIWIDFYKNLNDTEKIQDLFTYLSQIDLKGWNAKADRPVTRYLKSTMANSMSGVNLYLYKELLKHCGVEDRDVVDHNGLMTNGEGFATWFMPRSDFYNDVKYISTWVLEKKFEPTKKDMKKATEEPGLSQYIKMDANGNLPAKKYKDGSVKTSIIIGDPMGCLKRFKRIVFKHVSFDNYNFEIGCDIDSDNDLDNGIG